jgi:hypothetical protein
MVAQLLGAAVGSALFAGRVGWLVARRYGQRRGLVVPVLVLGAVVFSVWRAGMMHPEDAMGRVAFGMAFAGPAVLGALFGIALAGRRR